MTTYMAPMCPFCTRFREGGPKLTCDAFPDGIPKSIYLSEVDHRQPVIGDNGMQFNPKGKDAADYAKQIFEGKP